MEEFKFDSIGDLQIVVDNFYAIPKGQRLTVAKRVMNRLKELGSYVRVYHDNPIRLYKCDRFIVVEREHKSEFSKYADLAKNDKYNFNKTVFDEIEKQLMICTNIPDLTNKSNRLNYDADSIFKTFHDGAEHISLCKTSCRILASFYINGGVESVCHEALDQLEYLLTSGILTDCHVKRHLCYVKYLKKMSLHREIDTTEIAERIDALMQYTLEVPHNPFDMFRYGNRIDPVEQYMKMQKRAHEQAFVNSKLYSRDDEIHSSKINVEGLKEIKELVKNKPNIRPVITSDVFRLKENGFDNIEEYSISYKNGRLTGYRKNGVDYLVTKSVLDDCVYFFISRTRKGELKYHRVTCKPKTVLNVYTMETIIESTMINPNKVNRI